MMQPTVFLSYAREDTAAAMRLYESLAQSGVAVWMDKVSLLPGERWERSIKNAIVSARYFLALMSSASTAKRGFVQKEIRYALDVLEQYPDNEIYLLPIRIDDCQPTHDRLRDLNWTDLFPSWEAGVARVLKVVGPPRRTSFETISLSGLYQSQLIEHDDIEYFQYLRFFADGLVIAVSTPGTPEDIKSWFIRERSDSKGHYTIAGTSIRFSVVSAHGTVDYEGDLGDGEIIFRIHSHINGHRDIKVFTRVSD